MGTGLRTPLSLLFAVRGFLLFGGFEGFFNLMSGISIITKKFCDYFEIAVQLLILQEQQHHNIVWVPVQNSQSPRGIRNACITRYQGGDMFSHSHTSAGYPRTVEGMSLEAISAALPPCSLGDSNDFMNGQEPELAMSKSIEPTRLGYCGKFDGNIPVSLLPALLPSLGNEPFYIFLDIIKNDY